jgi:hypothetical protein
MSRHLSSSGNLGIKAQVMSCKLHFSVHHNVPLKTLLADRSKSANLTSNIVSCLHLLLDSVPMTRMSHARWPRNIMPSVPVYQEHFSLPRQLLSRARRVVSRTCRASIPMIKSQHGKRFVVYVFNTLNLTRNRILKIDNRCSTCQRLFHISPNMGHWAGSQYDVPRETGSTFVICIGL